MQIFASTIRNGSTLHKVLFSFLFVAALIAIPVGIGRADSLPNLMQDISRADTIQPMGVVTPVPEPDVDDNDGLCHIDMDEVQGSSVAPEVIPDPTEPDTDTDEDGIPYSVECAEALGILADMDGDGRKNCDDFDSDGDGISDLIERQQSGVIASQTSGPVNSDGDALPDYLDTDSDNDGISDTIEAFDFDGDGKPDVTASGIDVNNNGMDDAYEVEDIRIQDQDNDGDGLVVWLDVDEQPEPEEVPPTALPEDEEPEAFSTRIYLPIILQ